MRFIVMHKTNAYWEGGAKPSPEVMERVGRMVGELQASGALKSGEGLGSSAQGARVRLVNGDVSVARGPFSGKDAFPARYAMYRASSLDQAAEIAARFGRIFGDVTVDVRHVNEMWDLGFAPKPEGLTTRRYMAVVNADAASESGTPLSSTQTADLRTFSEDLGRKGLFIEVQHLEPSRKGKRVRPDPATKKCAVTDGPFAETKELIGGFVIVEVPTIDDAVRIAVSYGEAVDVEEMDVRGIVARASHAEAGPDL